MSGVVPAYSHNLVFVVPTWLNVVGMAVEKTADKFWDEDLLFEFDTVKNHQCRSVFMKDGHTFFPARMKLDAMVTG